MEDGEIEDLTAGGAYHPSLEWPGQDQEAPADSAIFTREEDLQTYVLNDYTREVFSDTREGASSPFARQVSSTTPSLRLVSLPSSLSRPAIHKAHTLAIIDGYTELQFGRDAAPPGSDKPRIRLKEMEVSKLHATIYWDPTRLEWAVVDMGSKHGTFLKSDTGTSSSQLGPTNNDSGGDSRGFRLSLPRVSSVPRRLRHLDQVSIGTTTFVVHIHDGGLPCEACSSRGGDELPLFSGANAPGAAELSKKRKRDGPEPPAIQQGDPRKALTMLKRTLLSRHSTPSRASPEGSSYMDRSALRRALHPDAPIANAIDTPPSSDPSASSTPASMSPLVLSRPPSPPAPLPSSNIGHRLLLKQGWTPGTALRPSEPDVSLSDTHASISLVTPLEAKGRTSRTGLGLPERSLTPSQPGVSWREEAKYRRWSDINSADPR